MRSTKVCLTLFFFIQLFVCGDLVAKSLRQAGRVWNDVVLQEEDSPWLYFLQNSLRARMQGQWFDENLTRMAIGHFVTSRGAIWFGYDIRMPYIDNRFVREQRTWQQLTEILLSKERLIIDSRSRLEQRYLRWEPQVAFRFRQRFQFRFPLFNSSRYQVVFHNETFFNLNHPKWIAPYAVDQNRAFIGIEFSFKSKLRVLLGYMNQFLVRPEKDFMNHVISFSAFFGP